MAQLDAEDREKLDKRKFADVDKEGEGHLPINDEAHLRNAMARFNRTDFESGTEKETARKKIVTAAKLRDIKVDNVAKGRKTAARKTAARRSSTPKTSTRKKTGSSRKRAKR